MTGYSSINFLLTVAVISTVLFWLGVKLFFTNYYAKTIVPVIKSADINISSSKIEEIILLFQAQMNCSNLKVVYERRNTYIKTFNNLNRKKGIIFIEKMDFNSVGYELDYLLGKLWISNKLYLNNKNIKNYRRLALVYPIISKVFYYVFFVLTLILFILAKVDLDGIIYKSAFLHFLYRIPILAITTLAAFLSNVILFLGLQQGKNNLEDLYEMEVSAFVKDNFVGYKSDFLAARVYSRSNPYFHIPIFRFTRNPENLKYFGPFNIL